MILSKKQFRSGHASCQTFIRKATRLQKYKTYISQVSGPTAAPLPGTRHKASAKSFGSTEHTNSRAQSVMRCHIHPKGFCGIYAGSRRCVKGRQLLSCDRHQQKGNTANLVSITIKRLQLRQRAHTCYIRN